MSKTYTLPIVAMAQLESGTSYKKNASFYPVTTRPLYLEIGPIPSALQDVQPSAATLVIGLHYIGTSQYPTWPDLTFYQTDGKINVNNDVYPDRRQDIPKIGYYEARIQYTTPDQSYQITVSMSSQAGLASILKSGIICQANNSYIRWEYIGPTGAIPAYLNLTYAEGSAVVTADDPKAFVDRTTETTFRWHTTYSGFPIETIPQTSATLMWKDGQSGTVNSISISGADTTYTMAANTLPESEELYWRVQTETAKGSSTSDWTKFRTADTGAYATAISPNGSYVDNSEPVRFLWSFTSDSGAPQYGYDLAVRGPADADFSIIQSETTANAFADVPAGTLPGGQILWRVRAYNQSGVAGEWSAALTCVVIAAPNAPEVWFEAVSPRPTVAWSAVGQLGYQVRVEGVYDSGTVFGTDKTFKIPVYLPDGMTTVQVRVLGEYDYWSPWGSASANIANPSSGSVTLTVREEDGDAVLTWIGTVQTPVFEILRGGKKIGETLDTTWTDRYANGETTYRIRAIPALHPDRYALSDPVSVSLHVESPRLTALDGAWIVLDTYTNPLPQTQISATRDVALTQYAGMDYPAAEVSRHRTRTYICNPAFADPAQAAAFEALLGRPVFVKDQYGTTMTGVMASVQRSVQRFYTVVTAVIQEIGGYEL